MQNEFEELISKSKKCEKMKYNLGEISKYLVEMNPADARTILLCRVGMLDIKANYSKKYDKNIKCKLCDQDETLDHLVNCEKTHKNLRK